MANRPVVQYVQFYTDGSAARKPVYEFSAPKNPLPKAHRPKRKVVYVDPVAILGIVVAVSMLIAMAVGVVQYMTIREETVQMEQYLEQLQQENAELSAQYEAGYDLQNVEKTALALGMIPAEQASYVTLPSTVQQTEVQTLTMWERIGTFLTGLFA